jgi:post-segregation antitoxin (ccd killing protein)
MSAMITLNDKLLRTAQDYTGMMDISALLNQALKALIHLEASRRLAALKSTPPEIGNRSSRLS